jgi:hypothetical protein
LEKFALARIIDLKNKKPQAPESVPRSRPAKPQEPTPLPRPVLETPKPRAETISWSGPFSYHQPDMKFVAAVSSALFIIAVLMQIFQKNIITTIFFGLLGALIVIRAVKKPGVINFEIGPLGIRAGERLYSFREIKSFWIEYNPESGIKELSLQLKKWYYTYVKIPIYDKNPVQLRLTLLAFLPEAEHEETLADVISRRLGL